MIISFMSCAGLWLVVNFIGFPKIAKILASVVLTISVGYIGYNLIENNELNKLQKLELSMLE